MPFSCCGLRLRTNEPKGTPKEEMFKQFEKDARKAELKEMKQMFKMFDSNKNGMITKDEVLAAMQKMQLDISPEDMMYSFMTYDTNGDDQLNFEEFRNMMKDIVKVKEYPVEKLFAYFDADNDGFVTLEEFQTAMHCLQMDIDDDIIRELLGPLFSPGTEKINYENFVILMKRMNP